MSEETRRHMFQVSGTWSQEARVSMQTSCSSDSLIRDHPLLEEVLDRHMFD